MSSLITIVSQCQRYIATFLLVVLSLFVVQIAQAATVTEVKAEMGMWLQHLHFRLVVGNQAIDITH